MMTWRARPLSLWSQSETDMDHYLLRRMRLRGGGGGPVSSDQVMIHYRNLTKYWNICSREYQNGDGLTDRVTPSLHQWPWSLFRESHVTMRKDGCTAKVKKCRSELISLWTIFKLKAGYYWTIFCVRPTFDAVIKTIRAITAITPMSEWPSRLGRAWGQMLHYI